MSGEIESTHRRAREPRADGRYRGAGVSTELILQVSTKPECLSVFIAILFTT